MLYSVFIIFFFKQKTAYEIRISDWSSDVCSSDLLGYMIDGRLVVTGRRKDLVILNGLNIWPQDVEWAVEALEDVRGSDVACFSVIEPDSSERMIVVLQCRLHDIAARENLRKRAAAQIGRAHERERGCQSV